MKRTYLFISLITFLTFAAQSVFLQTKSENHAALTSHHKIAKEHTNAILKGNSKTLEEHKKHANEAAENLEMAKKHMKI